MPALRGFEARRSSGRVAVLTHHRAECAAMMDCPWETMDAVGA